MLVMTFLPHLTHLALLCYDILLREATVNAATLLKSCIRNRIK